MKKFILYIKFLAKALLWGIIVSIGIFVCAVIWFNIDGKESKKDFSFGEEYRSLVHIDSLKDVIILKQIKVRKQLQRENDSLKNVLRQERIYINKYFYPKAKYKKEVKELLNKYKKEKDSLLNVVDEKNKDIEGLDSLLVEITELYNEQNK